jgi:hypothetical protein
VRELSALLEKLLPDTVEERLECAVVVGVAYTRPKVRIWLWRSRSPGSETP